MNGHFWFRLPPELRKQKLHPITLLSNALKKAFARQYLLEECIVQFLVIDIYLTHFWTYSLPHFRFQSFLIFLKFHNSKVN